MVTDTDKKIYKAKKQIAQQIAIALSLGQKERQNLVELLAPDTLEVGLRTAVATSGGNFALHNKNPPTVKDFRILLYLARQIVIFGSENHTYILLRLREFITDFASRSIASETDRLANIFKIYDRKHKKNDKKKNELFLDEDEIADEEFEEEIDLQ